MGSVGETRYGKLTDDNAMGDIAAAFIAGGGTATVPGSGVMGTLGHIRFEVEPRPNTSDEFWTSILYDWASGNWITKRMAKYYCVYISSRATGAGVICFSETAISQEDLGTWSTYDSAISSSSITSSGNWGFVIDKGQNFGGSSHAASNVIIRYADSGFYVFDGAATSLGADGPGATPMEGNITNAGYCVVGPLYGKHGGNVPANARMVYCYPEAALNTSCDVAINTETVRHIKQGIVV